MHSLLRDNKFCDVVITVADQHFPAHAVVLAAASEYLRNLLKNAVPFPPPSPSSSKEAGSSGNDPAGAQDKTRVTVMHITLDLDQQEQSRTPLAFAAVRLVSHGTTDKITHARTPARTLSNK
jgi:hypothetical protein